MAVCKWCGAELVNRDWGSGRQREYCTPSHRQAAYLFRLTPVALAALYARKAARRRRPSTKENDEHLR